MRVLIGTPAGGGEVTTQYLYSYVSMLGACIKNNIQPVLYTLSQESLLARGRNHIAQVAIKEKYDKLFFIDADSGWTEQQFLTICYSPFPIVAGLVPLKTFPIVFNYLPFKDDEQYFTNAMRTPESTRRMREAKGMSEIPVAYVGTAFLCIDKQVLNKLTETEDTYQYPNPFNGQQETHWNFFSEGPMHGQYLSEDWSFCEKARQAGYDIRANFDVQINHVGRYVYRTMNNVPVDMAPEIYRPLLHRVLSAEPDQIIEIDEELKRIVKDEQLIPQPVVHAPRAEKMESDFK